MTGDAANHASDTSLNALGRFITIEGIDGAGKSTLAGMLAHTLRLFNQILLRENHVGISEIVTL